MLQIDLRGWHVDEIALRVVDAKLFDRGENRAGVDEFCDGFDAHFFGEVDNGFNDDLGIFIFVDVFDETAIDLDKIGIELDDVGEVGKSASKIIDRDFGTVALDFIEKVHDFVEVVDPFRL